MTCTVATARHTRPTAVVALSEADGTAALNQAAPGPNYTAALRSDPQHECRLLRNAMKIWKWRRHGIDRQRAIHFKML